MFIIFIYLTVLEYAIDLKLHPKRSYQIPIVYQQNCDYAKYIVGFLRKARRKDRKRPGKLFTSEFNFVSSPLIMSMQTAFKFYKVSKLVRMNIKFKHFYSTCYIKIVTSFCFLFFCIFLWNVWLL